MRADRSERPQSILPPERRHTGRWRTSLTVFRHLLADRTFMGYALAGGLGFAAMFSYISGSPFVLQDVYGLSPQAFSGIFALNASGLIFLSQVSARVVHRTGPRRLLLQGLTASAVGGLGLVTAVLAGAGLAGSDTAVPMALVIAGVGVTGLATTLVTRAPAV